MTHLEIVPIYQEAGEVEEATKNKRKKIVTKVSVSMRLAPNNKIMEMMTNCSWMTSVFLFVFFLLFHFLFFRLLPRLPEEAGVRKLMTPFHILSLFVLFLVCVAKDFCFWALRGDKEFRQLPKGQLGVVEEFWPTWEDTTCHGSTEDFIYVLKCHLLQIIR